MANFVNLMDVIYPVGSIYITTNATSPADSIGGTWEQIENCLLAAGGDTYNLAGRYAGDDMIPMAAVPDHQHPVVSWHTAQRRYGTAAFWNTNAIGGSGWNLLSVGTNYEGSSGWTLYTKETWRTAQDATANPKQQKHIPYHYSLNVYKRTA